MTRPKSKLMCTASCLILYKVSTLSQQMPAVVVVRPKNKSFKVAKEGHSSKKNLKTKLSREQTIIYHIFDPHYQISVYTGGPRNYNDLSNRSRVSAFAVQKPAHFLFLPIVKLTELSSSLCTLPLEIRF